MQRLLILLTLIVAQSIPAVAESREKDLDRWVDRDLIPYVNQQLILHPRFKNETVMFVVLDDNAPAPASPRRASRSAGSRVETAPGSSRRRMTARTTTCTTTSASS